MSTSASQMRTAEHLANMPADGNRYELIQGELRMMSPAGFRHGRIAMRLGSLLEQHVQQHSLGFVTAAEMGFLLARNPDTVRAPDVAFVRADRLDESNASDDFSGYLPVAPDLVGEVMSPNDSLRDADENSLFWLDHGSLMALVIDPGKQTIRVHEPDRPLVVLQIAESLRAEHVVAGWTLRLADLFCLGSGPE